MVQVQLCKYFIEINDTARESTVWGEINVLRYVLELAAAVTTSHLLTCRFAMLEYGSRSPIGSKPRSMFFSNHRYSCRFLQQFAKKSSYRG